MPEVFEVKEWFADVIKGLNVPEEEAKALLKTLEREDIRKNIGNSVLRQSDYSRRSDELKVREGKLSETEATIKEKGIEADVFVQRQKDRDHNNEELFTQLNTDLIEANRRLEELGEEPKHRSVKKPPVEESSPKYVTADELEKRDAERESHAISYANKVQNLSNRFHADFKEYLDPDKLVEHATEKGLTLDLAYDDLFKDRYVEKSEKEVKTRIETAVEEARVEERSRSGVPLVEEGPGRVAVFDVPVEDRLLTEDSRVGAATAALKEVRSGKRQISPQDLGI